MSAGDGVRFSGAARMSVGAVAVLTGAHLFHDLYLGFLGILLPFLRESLGFGLVAAGLLQPAQQVGSLLQPVLGGWADRFGARRFVLVFLGLTGLTFSMLGASPSYPVLIGLLVLGGLSSAAYHPAGSAMVTSYAGDRMGTALSAYHFGGNVGLAVGPMLASAVVVAYGLRATPLLVVPALAWVVLAGMSLRRDPEAKATGGVQERTLGWIWSQRRSFAPLFVIILGRAIGAGGLTLFLPTILLDRGYSVGFVALLTSGYFLFGGIGGVLSGWFSDRVGRHPVLMTLLVVAPLSVFGFLVFDSTVGLVLLLLAATALLGEQPVVMALVQEWAPRRKGAVVGTVLGAQFVLAGLGSFLVGWIGDNVGLEQAMRVVALAPLVGVPFIRRLGRGPIEDDPVQGNSGTSADLG